LGFSNKEALSLDGNLMMNVMYQWIMQD